MSKGNDVALQALCDLSATTFSGPGGGAWSLNLNTRLARFEVITVLYTIFWNVIPFTSEVHQRFERRYCLHIQGSTVN
jgi:hypothetical protein